jgi:hypothetical protein
MFTTWGESVRGSFVDVWGGVSGFVPSLVFAFVLFVLGWAVGGFLGKIVSQIVGALKIDSILKGAKIDTVFHKAGVSLNTGNFIGGLIKWFVILVFLIASFDILKLTQVTAFLQQIVVLYLPNVIAAAFILIVAVLIADTMQKIVAGSANAAGIKSANFIGLVTKWSIWIFAVLMALLQLGIVAQLINTLFMGVVVAGALAFGLSFGLGGQHVAAEILSKLKHDVSSRNIVGE